MQINNLGAKTFASSSDLKVQRKFLDLFKNSPIPDDEVLDNMGLFVTSKLLAKMLFLHHLYLLQLHTHGVVMEFGTRWGQNALLFSTLRGIYEPFNRHRKIIAFDTFEGFVGTGEYNVTPNYDKYLSKLMACQEKLNPASHIRKYEVIKGDATRTLEKYLDKHPETIVSLAYFDMDLYEPTKRCLELLKPYLNRGSVVGFDELCDETFSGETMAFREVFGQDYKLQRLPITARASYIIME